MPFQPPSFLLTIDVEDWFQVENFKSAIPFSSWNDMELRVEKNTHKILDLFDELSESFPSSALSSSLTHSQWPIAHRPSPIAHSPSPIAHRPSPIAHRPSPIFATFFILGWIAERLPELVREINNRGHEVASHGFCHHLCTEQDNKALRKDLTDSRKLLEDITGDDIHGYRAPSFSINNDTLKIIEDAGYRYDASYNSFDKHGRYGRLDVSSYRKTGIAYQVSDNFHELPVSNISYQLSAISYQPIVFPWSGGGYFRLLPLSIFKLGIQKLLKQENAYHFYFHPWEIDPGQPRVDGVSRMFKFRHYINISKTYDKLRNLISTFRHCRFQTLSQYLQTLEKE